MAIRCFSKCKYNHGGWCDLDYIEIDEDGTCMYHELDDFPVCSINR